MKRILTVTGSIGIEEVRRILPHEHFLIDCAHEAIPPKSEAEQTRFYGEIRMENLGLLRRNPYVVRTNLILDELDAAVEETKPLLDCGCNVVIDVTSVGIHRDVKKLREISERTGLHVVCACGLFVHDSKVAAYRDWTEDQISAWMMREIREGIDGTGIRPGVIGEIGTSEVIYPFERKSLLAAARASVESGLPVYVHTYPWSRAGLEAIELLMSQGVPAAKICICHLDVCFDEAYIWQVLDRGVYLEFDNLSKEYCFEPVDGAFAGGPFETDWARVEMLKKIIVRGHVKQILLSNDVCLKASLKKYGGWGYTHVYENFVPMMRMGGVHHGDIEQIIDENPKRFLFAE